MKKIITSILFWLPVLVHSQQDDNILFVNESKIDISAGMGIAAIYTNNLSDYLDSYSSTIYYSKISTIPVFFVNCEYRFSDNYGIKIDYNYMLKTYNIESISFVSRNINISYYIQSPAVLLNYIIRDKGYLLKLGAGLSYNYTELETNASMGMNTTYKSNGFGFRIDAHGHTQMSKNIYLIFALGIGSGFLSDLKSDSGHILITSDKNVDISFLSASLNFGLAYYF
jgi:hypothetical protein